MSVNLYNATTDTLKNVAGDIINPKSVNNTIAPTEETTTASRAYNVGEQFFLNDVLYKATANISQGDTITIGTNCSVSDKLTEQIDATVEKWSGTDSGNTYVTVDKLAYDPTNKRLGLKVNGADTVVPFKKEIVIPSFKFITSNSGNNTIYPAPEIIIDVTDYSLLSIAQYTGVDYGWGYVYLDGVQKAYCSSSQTNISVDLTNGSELKFKLQYNLNSKVTFGFTDIVIS